MKDKKFLMPKSEDATPLIVNIDFCKAETRDPKWDDKDYEESYTHSIYYGQMQIGNLTGILFPSSSYDDLTDDQKLAYQKGVAIQATHLLGMGVELLRQGESVNLGQVNIGEQNPDNPDFLDARVLVILQSADLYNTRAFIRNENSDIPTTSNDVGSKAINDILYIARDGGLTSPEGSIIINKNDNNNTMEIDVVPGEISTVNSSNVENDKLTEPTEGINPDLKQIDTNKDNIATNTTAIGNIPTYGAGDGIEFINSKKEEEKKLVPTTINVKINNTDFSFLTTVLNLSQENKDKLALLLIGTNTTTFKSKEGILIMEYDFAAKTINFKVDEDIIFQISTNVVNAFTDLDLKSNKITGLKGGSQLNDSINYNQFLFQSGRIDVLEAKVNEISLDKIIGLGEIIPIAGLTINLSGTYDFDYFKTIKLKLNINDPTTTGYTVYTFSYDDIGTYPIKFMKIPILPNSTISNYNDFYYIHIQLVSATTLVLQPEPGMGSLVETRFKEVLGTELKIPDKIALEKYNKWYIEKNGSIIEELKKWTLERNEKVLKK